MTIITKPISEKKIDKLDQPLVVSIHTEFPTGGNGDYRSGGEGGSVAGSDPNLFVPRTCYTRSRRASSATTVCLFLTALMVMSFGVLSGIYLYRQFALAQMHRYRGRCRIPFEEVTNSAIFQQEDEAKSLDDLNVLQKLSQALSNHFENPDLENGKYFDESYIMDDNHEKLTTTFQGGKHNTFIYDFGSNETGIIDHDTNRCFVMPLDRAQVLPPKNLNDLLKKMRNGYYELDFSILRQSMRVITPAVSDRNKLGMFIQRDCQKYPIYQLKQIEQPIKVQKRSAETGENVYTVFNGKTTQFQLVNLHEVEEYEQKLKEAQS